jgi:hypothetical protein
MWKKNLQLERLTDDNMAYAHCTLGTWVHSEYAISIAFTRQQWLHECALLLHYIILAVLFGI